MVCWASTFMKPVNQITQFVSGWVARIAMLWTAKFRVYNKIVDSVKSNKSSSWLPSSNSLPTADWLETFRRNLNQPLQMAAISLIITFWYIGEKNWMPHQKETLASLPFFSWKSENWFDVMSKAVKHIFKTRSLFTRTIFNHVFRVSSFSPFKYKAMRIAQTTEPMEFPERVQRHGFVV